MSPSMIGIQECSTFDIMTIIAFLSLNSFMVFYEVRRIRRVQDLKREQKRDLAEGELEITGKTLSILIFGSVLGGLVGSFGMGGAIVFNPVMLSLGV